MLLAMWLTCTAFAELPQEAREAWARLDQVQSLRANFTQLQHRAVLSRPLEATGTLAFSRPSQLRWEVKTPVQSVFVLDGTRVGQAVPALGSRTEVDLASQPEWARLVEAMTVWMAGDVERLERDYEVSWTDGVATLEPRQPPLSNLVDHLELTVATDHVERVVWVEPSGDRMELELHDVERGVKLPAETFRLP